MNNKVTLFRRSHLTGSGNEFETDLFTMIRTHKYKDEVRELRVRWHSLPIEEFDRLKMELLPVYTGCCTCEGGHQTGTIKALSGYVIIDVEVRNIRDIPVAKKFFSSQCFVAAVWRSCCGSNLHVAIPFTDQMENFQRWWFDASGFFILMGYRVYEASKNIMHPTLVSYDPEPYINENAWDWFNIKAYCSDEFVKPLKRQ